MTTTTDTSEYRREPSCQDAMRRPQARKHQTCDHCGGRFGMVTHRWWAHKFCKRACKNAHLREFALDRDTIRRWFGLARPSRDASYWRFRALRSVTSCR
jgi:hypothetical protein